MGLHKLEEAEATEATLPHNAREVAQVKRLHGLDLPLETFEMASAEETRQKITKLEAELKKAKAELQHIGESYTITVRVSGSDDLQQTVRSGEASVLLKLGLYN